MREDLKKANRACVRCILKAQAYKYTDSSVSLSHSDCLDYNSKPWRVFPQNGSSGKIPKPHPRPGKPGFQKPRHSICNRISVGLQESVCYLKNKRPKPDQKKEGFSPQKLSLACIQCNPWKWKMVAVCCCCSLNLYPDVFFHLRSVNKIQPLPPPILQSHQTPSGRALTFTSATAGPGTYTPAPPL